MAERGIHTYVCASMVHSLLIQCPSFSCLSNLVVRLQPHRAIFYRGDVSFSSVIVSILITFVGIYSIFAKSRIHW